LTDSKTFRVKPGDLDSLVRIFGIFKELTLNGADTDITISDHEDEATLEQKKYRWAIIGKIAENYHPEGRSYSKDAWNEHFKQEFVGVEELPSGRIKGISPKGKHGMSDFITQIEVFAAEHEVNIE